MAIRNMPYSLFAVTGIEIEYMLVRQGTLEILSMADKVLEQLGGKLTNEVNDGEIAISNELVLHVIELKTNGPKEVIHTIDQAFHERIKQINALIEPLGGCLLPTGAHPLLDPKNGVALWPHGDRQIYATYDRIFNCHGHGWSNLQSTHINLPFANDEEFAKLHNAIRLLLPLIPALTASTPFLEGKRSAVVDTRLLFYGGNQRKIPLIAGEIIPEFVLTPEAYQENILQPMYQAIAPFDTAGILQHEWLNSRGAIPRFERNAIEIRIMDTQEAPLADITCLTAIIGVLKYLIEETEQYLANPMASVDLANLYQRAIKEGFAADFSHPDYAKQFHLADQQLMTARDYWEILLVKASAYITDTQQVILEKILAQGNLAERMLKKQTKTQATIKQIYQHLSECLANNTLFLL